LADPTGDGECLTDYFTIENGGSFVPRICGQNTGGHVYVDFPGSFPISIIVATTLTNSFFRQWELRVTQIGCHSLFRGLSIKNKNFMSH
jgi:hypothetical protein